MKATVYKYRSPYRPLPLAYLPKDIEWLYDYSDIGLWNPKSIYAFSKPIPENLISQWSLQLVSYITLPTGETYPTTQKGGQTVP